MVPDDQALFADEDGGELRYADDDGDSDAIAFDDGGYGFDYDSGMGADDFGSIGSSFWQTDEEEGFYEGHAGEQAAAAAAAVAAAAGYAGYAGHYLDDHLGGYYIEAPWTAAGGGYGAAAGAAAGCNGSDGSNGMQARGGASAWAEGEQQLRWQHVQQRGSDGSSNSSRATMPLPVPHGVNPHQQQQHQQQGGPASRLSPEGSPAYYDDGYFGPAPNGSGLQEHQAWQELEAMVARQDPGRLLPATNASWAGSYPPRMDEILSPATWQAEGFVHSSWSPDIDLPEPDFDLDAFDPEFDFDFDDEADLFDFEPAGAVE